MDHPAGPQAADLDAFQPPEVQRGRVRECQSLAVDHLSQFQGSHGSSDATDLLLCSPTFGGHGGTMLDTRALDTGASFSSLVDTRAADDLAAFVNAPNKEGDAYLCLDAAPQVRCHAPPSLDPAPEHTAVGPPLSTVVELDACIQTSLPCPEQIARFFRHNVRPCALLTAHSR